jgi:hypothetical protein
MYKWNCMYKWKTTYLKGDEFSKRIRCMAVSMYGTKSWTPSRLTLKRSHELNIILDNTWSLIVWKYRSKVNSQSNINLNKILDKFGH